jgi:hypothetical protein
MCIADPTAAVASGANRLLVLSQSAESPVCRLLAEYDSMELGPITLSTEPSDTRR